MSDIRFEEDEESLIHNMVEQGYLSGVGEPLKCYKCGSVSMLDDSGYEDQHIVHISRSCGRCGTHLGEWDYGSWSW